jgi:CDGSH-type Zn-finger protein
LKAFLLGALPMSEPLVIRCRENGPLVIQGLVRVVDHAGNEFAIAPGKDTIALCRCGASKNKPFCDGSHKACGFLAANLATPPEGIPPS